MRILQHLLFLIIITISTPFIAQKAIIEESFKTKSFDENLKHNVWGAQGEITEAKFTFSDLGRDDNSSLKVFIQKNHRSNPQAHKASINIFGISLSKNKNYKISFWIKTKRKKDNVAVILFSSKDTGSKNDDFAILLNKTISFEGDGSWKKKEITFTALKKSNLDKPIDLKNLAFGMGFNTRSGTFLVDDIKIEKI